MFEVDFRGFWDAALGMTHEIFVTDDGNYVQLHNEETPVRIHHPTCVDIYFTVNGLSYMGNLKALEYSTCIEFYCSDGTTNKWNKLSGVN